MLQSLTAQIVQLVYSGGWQDFVISAGLLVFIGSVAAMILDDETTVAPVKAGAYGSAQLLIGVANASLGLWVSTGLLFIGASLWYALGVQGYQTGTYSPKP